MSPCVRVKSRRTLVARSWRSLKRLPTRLKKSFFSLAWICRRPLSGNRLRLILNYKLLFSVSGLSSNAMIVRRYVMLRRV